MFPRIRIGKKSLILWLLAAAVAVTTPASRAAVPQQTNWRFFTPVDGLAEAWSSYITLGPSGRVWISHGGIDEVSWLDGWPGENGQYVNTMTNPGPDLKIFESHSGQLWSLHEFGIQLYTGGIWEKFFVEDISNPYLPDNILRKLTPFAPGRWNQAYYLLPGSLMKFDATDESKEEVLGVRNAGIGDFRQVVPAKSKGLWMTGSAGVGYYGWSDSTGDGNWTVWDLSRFGLVDFDNLEEGDEGELIVTGSSPSDGSRHLLRLRGSHWTRLADCSGEIVRAWPGLDQDYWVLKADNQLVNVRRAVERVEESVGILAAEIRDVEVDRDGIFWLTTSHGVARYSPCLWRTPPAVEDQKAWVHSILEDAMGRIWFSCSDRIIKYDNNDWQVFKLPENISSQPFGTQSFCELADGRLAIGTLPYRNFLLTFDPRNNEFGKIPYHNDNFPALEPQTNIGLMKQHGKGRILVETRLNKEPSGFRLEVFDGENFEVIFDQWENVLIGNPRFFMETSDGALWVGGAGQTGNRLLVIEKGEYKFLEMPSMFKDNGVFAIREVAPGKVWIGGRNYILQYYKDEWEIVRAGLSSVRSIITTPDTTVWVVSGTGVHRFHDGSWVSNSQQDGLPNDGVFCIFQDSRGRTWAGTIEGLSLYSPQADVFPPQTLISESQNLRETPPGGEVRLVYAGLDKWNYTDDERLLFSYRLDSGEWSDFVPGNMAVFNHLPFGPHNFEVRAMDVNFNRDEEPAGYEFTVLKPWYRESGFQLIMGAGTLIIIFLIGVAVHRHIMLEKLVVERTNDLQVANVQLKKNLHELIDTQSSLELEQKKLEIALGHENLLAGIASMLNSTMDLPYALREVMQTIRVRLKLYCACLTDIDESGNRIFERISSGRGGKGNGETPGCGFCSGKSALLMSVLKDRGILVAEDQRSSEGISLLMAGTEINSFCALPVTKSGTIKGIACFCRKENYDWPDEDRELLGTAMNMIASAWERHSEFQARLQAEKKQYEALQIADKASRLASIGVIAAGITHEINQPLNDIKVTADSVMMWDKSNRGILPDEFSTWLQSISGSVNRITGIIKQMRTYWVTPGQSANEPVNLAESVTSAVSLVGHQLDAHGVALNVVCGDGELMVLGNKVNLEQIVLNLVVNAMHALDEMAPPKKHVTVTIGRQDGQALIKVSDNGPGIDSEQVGKLFDPFFTTKKSLDGMGLGLAIVKRFTEGFGGRVFAGNNPDGGACFTVQLPLIESKQDV